jgi:YHS domain-containing protein
MCGLRMKGVADHASTHAGYTLHFCSDACKKHFDEDATKALAALNVPGK